jgi:hypothetical protein
MEGLRLKVGCTKYPNMNDEQVGFACRKSDSVCMEPRYAYQNRNVTGYIHTRSHDELNVLVNQIGAMSKEEF